MKVYRIQDSEGRGPFKPGFSHRWADRRAYEDELPPWYVELPDVLGKVRSTTAKHAFGTGCKSPDQLRRWFSMAEYQRLVILGYAAVELDADKVYGESANQCVFGRKRPLRKGARPFELYETPNVDKPEGGEG